MKKDRKILAAIIINAALVILAVIGAAMNIKNRGSFAASLVFYTQDSNIFLGIASLIYAAYSVKGYRNGSYAIPAWVQKMKYYSVCCIAVTLFVVIFILAPMAESLGGLRWLLFSGSMLYQHLLSPVIAIIGFILFEKKPVLLFRSTLYALIPTLLYAAVMYPLNIAGIVDGPYPFLQVRNMSVGMSVLWFFAILALSYLLAWLVWLLNRKCFGRKAGK